MKKIFLCLFVFSIILSACNQDLTDEVLAESKAGDLVENSVLKRIQDLGFSLDDLVEYEDRYVVEGDIAFDKNFTGSDTDVTLRHIQDNNVLVTKYLVVIYVEPNFVKPTTDIMIRITDAVIKAYNDVDCRLAFSRTTDRNKADIIIKRDITVKACAEAGLPNNGKVYHQVRVADSNLSENQMTYLIAHEISHTIGFRHVNGHEQVIRDHLGSFVPGTPAFESASVMSGGTCGAQWKGFTESDKRAIRTLHSLGKPVYGYYLYPGTTSLKTGKGGHMYSCQLPNAVIKGDNFAGSFERNFDGVVYPFAYHDFALPTYPSYSYTNIYRFYSSSSRRYKLDSRASGEYNIQCEHLGFVFDRYVTGTVPLKEYYISDQNSYMYVALKREEDGLLLNPSKNPYIRTLGYVYPGARRE